MFSTLLLTTTLAALTSAHTAAWTQGMYCKDGNTSTPNPNTNTAVNPLYQLPKEKWWFQHDRSCDLFPPSPGEFLELPANGEFTVELAHNRGQTTLTDPDADRLQWPDGQDHPDDWNSWEGPGSPCLEDGAMHAYNETSAAGTAWAISYESEIEKVTLENLVVFSTLQHTPWKRRATYQVPDLMACPEGGVTVRGFAPAQAPVYCADDASKCVKGAKQMIAWHQETGNNIETADGISPGYNEKCGWTNGAQHDIFGRPVAENF
ncbi:hypothetical protein GRF29_19g760106 [Pseudopithomyces chartarum]|uniref:Uncharacterized protein n=1 Tax=Pseudopithomyces chartarum TaxID=1892770 RepID=A0AAN6RIK7_9PLEO|nr:hypothetical protein GRF29_19g760106 [Pseudopithomyces chartarum]